MHVSELGAGSVSADGRVARGLNMMRADDILQEDKSCQTRGAGIGSPRDPSGCGL